MKNGCEITFHKPQNAKESKTVSGRIKQENAIQANKKYKDSRKDQRERYPFTEMNFSLVNLLAHSFNLWPKVREPKSTAAVNIRGSV